MRTSCRRNLNGSIVPIENLASLIKRLLYPAEATPSDASFRRWEYDLSVAVRSSSPRYVVKALLEANLHQIGITHRNRGSILHEALKHRASDDVLSICYKQ
jgi:hypothetical protein